jgi:hypothetical protein
LFLLGLFEDFLGVFVAIWAGTMQRDECTNVSLRSKTKHFYHDFAGGSNIYLVLMADG